MEANDGQAVVAVQDVSRRFGKKQVLDRVSFEVRQGRVLGLVGENGAGKTTLIKHMLGALRPNKGSVRVFGIDPAWDPPAVLSRIGYLPEDRDLPMWMRVAELLRYTRAFYPSWDPDYAEELREQFELPSDARIRHLSRGEKAKTGLLVALAHRPDLLLLDEPSSGLDAVARREILAAVVRSVAEVGRTVVFSSHLLDEVERVADDIVMVHEGAVELRMPIDELRAAHHRFVVRFEQEQPAFPEVAGVLHAVGEGQEWEIICHGDADAIQHALRDVGGEIVEETIPSLDTVFVARVSGGRQKRAAV